MPREPLALDARVDGGPDTYHFHTADGVHSPDAFRPAELRLLETLWDVDNGRLCCPQANYGVVGTVLGAQANAVTMTETSARAAALCARNADANGVEATVDCRASLDGLDTADTVAYAPKPYTPVDVECERLVAAVDCLASGGDCYLAGRPEGGIERYEACLDKLGATPETVATGDCRVLHATRPETVEPPTYVAERTIEATVDGVDLALCTRPGLFSATELDPGTRLLCETAEPRDSERVLDLCCGYGAVGAYAASAADCEVWLTDDDARATDCAARSLDATGVAGEVVTADGVEGVYQHTFDRVLSNPPTHAGDGVLADLFDGVHDVLAPNGVLTLVHHGDLDLRPHLRRFEGVERVVRGEHHVILRARP